MINKQIDILFRVFLVGFFLSFSGVAFGQGSPVVCDVDNYDNPACEDECMVEPEGPVCSGETVYEEPEIVEPDTGGDVEPDLDTSEEPVEIDPATEDETSTYAEEPSE